MCKFSVVRHGTVLVPVFIRETLKIGFKHPCFTNLLSAMLLFSCFRNQTGIHTFISDFQWRADYDTEERLENGIYSILTKFKRGV